MDAKDFTGDDGGDGEAVEDVDEGFPNFNRGAAFTFVVEAVDWGVSCKSGMENPLLRLRIRGFHVVGKSFLASGVLKQIINTPFLDFGGLNINARLR